MKGKQPANNYIQNLWQNRTRHRSEVYQGSNNRSSQNMMRPPSTATTKAATRCTASKQKIIMTFTHTHINDMLQTIRKPATSPLNHYKTLLKTYKTLNPLQLAATANRLPLGFLSPGRCSRYSGWPQGAVARSHDESDLGESEHRSLISGGAVFFWWWLKPSCLDSFFCV